MATKPDRSNKFTFSSHALNAFARHYDVDGDVEVINKLQKEFLKCGQRLYDQIRCGGPKSLTPQLLKFSIFARVSCRRAEPSQKFQISGVAELGSCGVTELRGSDLYILNSGVRRTPVWSPWSKTRKGNN